MRAGALKHIVEILKSSITKNEFGEEIETWTTYITTRCEVIRKGGNRQNQNNEIFYSSNISINIRDYNKIDEFNRIKLDGTLYRILSITPNEDYRYITVDLEKINK